jgi:AraC family transcriptional activator of tynA and feaB
MVTGDAAHTMHAGRTHRLTAGGAIVIDSAQPVDVTRSQHRTISLMLGRDRVRAAIGQDPSILAGIRLPSVGLSKLLQSHMRIIIDEAEGLSAEHRAIALDIAAEMALSVLQQMVRERFDPLQCPLGLYQAACEVIERRCSDPELTPNKVVSILNCSRAALYRLFARQAESVAATIWIARLERARTMLLATRYADLRVSEIAFRSGFVDQPTFNRMFKRRYGVTPGEVRLR